MLALCGAISNDAHQIIAFWLTTTKILFFVAVDGFFGLVAEAANIIAIIC